MDAMRRKVPRWPVGRRRRRSKGEARTTATRRSEPTILRQVSRASIAKCRPKCGTSTILILIRNSSGPARPSAPRSKWTPSRCTFTSGSPRSRFGGNSGESRAAVSFCRSLAAADKGHRVLQARHGLVQPLDPWRLTARNELAATPGADGSEDPNDLYGSTLWGGLPVKLPAAHRPAGREGSSRRVINKRARTDQGLSGYLDAEGSLVPDLPSRSTAPLLGASRRHGQHIRPNQRRKHPSRSGAAG